MNNLMALWGEDFHKFYPKRQHRSRRKRFVHRAAGADQWNIDLRPMSRTMKSEEIDEFEKKYGYKPTAVSTAIDMLAVYVHKDNPIEFRTLQQLDAIFSKHEKRRKSRRHHDLGTTRPHGRVGQQAHQSLRT